MYPQKVRSGRACGVNRGLKKGLMRKKYLRKVWWAITALYLMVVYSTLGVAPRIWDGFNASLGGKGTIPVYIVFFIAAVCLFAYMIFVKKERSPNSYLLFFLFVWIFLALNRLSRFPVEKIHLIEYALLGVFVYNALKIDIDRFDKKLYLFGSLFCLSAGFLDEIIQLLLPNRVFDWRDAVLNAAGSVIALMVIRFNILKEPQKP